MRAFSKAAHWIFLLGAAAYVRLAWLPGTWDAGTFRFTDPDSLYHLRQIRWAARIFPFVPVRDAALPTGVSPWPGGFDWLYALFVAAGRAAGFSGPAAEEALAGTLVALTGLGTVAVSVILARRVYGNRAGWIAGWMAALLPVAVDSSKFGRVDHHLFEPLVLLFGLLPGVGPVVRGAGLGLSLMVSQSVLIPVGIVAVSRLLGLALTHSSRQSLFDEARIPLAALLVSCPLVFLTAWAHGVWFDYSQVNLFQLGVLGIWLLGTAAFAAKGRRRLILACAAAALAGGLAMPLARSAEFLTRNPVVALISESRPFFLKSAAMGYLTDNFFLWVPYLFVATAYFVRFPRRRVTRTASLLAASVVTLGLALVQLRFAVLAGAMMCVHLPALFDRAEEWLSHRLKRRLGRRSRYLGPAFLLALVGWLVLSFRPYTGGSFAREMIRPPQGWTEPRRGLFTALEDLRAFRKAADLEPASAGPVSGRVLSFWYLGHHILYYGGSPPVATPFIFDPATSELRESLDVLLLLPTGEALRRMEDRRIEYVLLPSWEETCREAAIQVKAVDAGRGKSFIRDWFRDRCRSPEARLRGTLAGAALSPHVVTEGSLALRVVSDVRSARTNEILYRILRLETR